MYRLVLYVLTALWAVAIALGFFGMLALSPSSLFFSTIIILAVSWMANKLFSRIFRAPTNVESVYITAFILALIIEPADFSHYTGLALVVSAAFLAQASKYILAIKKKHIFNPAALAIAMTALVLNQSASWWIGDTAMIPFVLLGGLLITRKIRRSDLVLSFFVVLFAVTSASSLIQGQNPLDSIFATILHSPYLFFAFIMLTEPLTTPPGKGCRIAYGALAALLCAPGLHFGSLYMTPEFSLLAGNIFSYFVGPKQKLVLRLREKRRIAPEVYDFAFTSSETLRFKPGQYLEWTLPHEKSDSRGNRRYFTVAASPTEEEVRLGIKFNEPASSFKRTLLEMKEGDRIAASGVAGDFTLPHDTKEKLVFMAGGIGITPFRSMIKYLLDKGEKRDIVLFYSNRTSADVAYGEMLDLAREKLGIRTIHVATEESGHIDAAMIREHIPDYRERMFYLSGPYSMVTAFEKTLKGMKLPRSRIKTDFFPGFA